MPNAAAVGFFGKLPCRGDFLQRRVPRDFLDVWDPWLQRCIDQSARALRDRWLGAYLNAPVWRFVLAEGICGPSAYAGVMVSGVDRVGRYFPLTIVAQWPAQECALESACDAWRWFDSAEAVALTAPEAVDLEAFDAQVARLTALIDTSGAEESAHLRGLLSRTDTLQRAGQWHVPLSSVHSLQRAMSALALRELERTLRPVSLWWSDGSDSVEAAWLSARGLPEPDSFAAMLSGEWSTTGWSSLGAAMAPRMQPQPLLQAQELQITAVHESMVHESMDQRWVDGQGSASASETCFTARPEIGLWGVATALDAEGGHAAAQAVADVLQSIRPAGSLTALVEQVRAMLDALLRQFAARSSVAAGANTVASAVVFVTAGSECAVLCVGPAQAVRCRSCVVTPVCGVGPSDMPVSEIPGAPLPVRDTDAVNGTLLDLITGSAVPCVTERQIVQVRVCYESVQPDDGWLISAAPLLEERLLPGLAAAFQAGEMAMVRNLCADQDSAGRPLPVLMLTVQARAMASEPAGPGRGWQG